MTGVRSRRKNSQSLQIYLLTDFMYFPHRVYLITGVRGWGEQAEFNTDAILLTDIM